ncbi:MAG: ABC transporter ATP-binding protein [Tenericutes bacterium]|nr:ABC transporter ATP-binding protein [Mycoplasmatota bacterium]
MKQYENILEIKDLSVSVHGNLILSNLNLVIPKGEIHALLGKNGSGKTTLMNTIMGFSGYEIVSGQILYKGQDICTLEVNERARIGIAIAQQRPPIIHGVKLQNILDYIFKDQIEKDKFVNQFATDAQMEDFLQRSINDGLSGGEIKRAELLQLICMNPEFAMMDEPDSGVDIEALKLIGSLVNQLFSTDNLVDTHKSGLIITHSGNVLDYLKISNAHIMQNGKIQCSGNVGEIIKMIKLYGYDGCIQEMRNRG